VDRSRTVAASSTFDLDYSEEVVLRNGQRVRLRAVRPPDKQRLQEGLQKLSTDALIARFFTVKRRFTRQELEYLTEFDGIDHYAIGALLLNDDGSEGEGIGVGRFARMPDDPESAEPAVVVLDEWQNQGLGSLLFDRLVDAARERGIRRFHAEFLPDNEGIQRLLQRICPDLLIWRQGEILVADVPLSDAGGETRADPARSGLSALLRLAAKQLIRLQGSRAGAEQGGSAA
jgi:GNAT superfamily N-acetyltransferase